MHVGMYCMVEYMAVRVLRGSKFYERKNLWLSRMAVLVGENGPSKVCTRTLGTL